MKMATRFRLDGLFKELLSSILDCTRDR